MKTVCASGQCVGCMACIDACKFGAITVKDDLKEYNAVIDQEKCVSCGACEKTCQINVEVPKQEPIFWKQGWVTDTETRKSSASGGIAATIIKSFLKTGVVYTCVFKEGEFIFEQINQDNFKKAQGSKYVKSNPKGIYAKIKQDLKEGKKVLFIGLPCQVAAIKLRLGDNENFYSIDLICHGTPSPNLLEKFLEQYKTSLSTVETVSFRAKKTFQISADGKEIATKGCLDSYMIAFLEGLSYTENCYNCKYACNKRVGDITLGDSWGTDLTNELASGVSLVLCQTEKGKELLDSPDIELFDVDVEKAKKNNHQLEAPSQKPSSREKFFKMVKSGKSVNKSVFYCLPKKSIKQKIKAVLIWLKIKK